MIFMHETLKNKLKQSLIRFHIKLVCAVSKFYGRWIILQPQKRSDIVEGKIIYFPTDGMLFAEASVMM